MFFMWCGMSSKETEESNFQMPKDFDGYEFYVTSGVLKTTHGETVLKMERSMVILSLGYLNG